MLRTVRRYFHDVLEPATERHQVLSRAVDVFILALIAASVAALALETVPSLSAPYRRVFFEIEYHCVYFFTVEYVLRLWTCVEDGRFSGAVKGRLRYALSAYALIDLCAILPFYMETFLPFSLISLRALRLIRIFKAARYSAAVRVLGEVLQEKKEQLVLALSLLLVLLLISSNLIYFAENEAQPGVFSSIPAAMWWAVATLSTVGYGDMYPVTGLGKVIGSFISILGIGFFALPAGIMSSGFSSRMQRRRSDWGTCPHCGQSVFTGGPGDSPERKPAG
ncbi:MAG: ion transporter [Thermodesulfobacteriota bacterium]